MPTTASTAVTDNQLLLAFISSGAAVTILKCVRDIVPVVWGGIKKLSGGMYGGIRQCSQKYGYCIPQSPYELFLHTYITPSANLAEPVVSTYFSLVESIFKDAEKKELLGFTKSHSNKSFSFKTPRTESSIQLLYKGDGDLPNESVLKGGVIQGGINQMNEYMRMFLKTQDLKKIEGLISDLSHLYQAGIVSFDIKNFEDREKRQFPEFFVYVHLQEKDAILNQKIDDKNPLHMLIKTSITKPEKIDLVPSNTTDIMVQKSFAKKLHSNNSSDESFFMHEIDLNDKKFQSNKGGSTQKLLDLNKDEEDSYPSHKVPNTPNPKKKHSTDFEEIIIEQN